MLDSCAEIAQVEGKKKDPEGKIRGCTGDLYIGDVLCKRKSSDKEDL